MPICRYFAQGWCRFGDRCRFEHLDDSHRRRQPQREGDRYHWVKPATQNASTTLRAATFDFNAALQNARTQDSQGRFPRGGWDQGRHQDAWGQPASPQGFSHGGSYLDYLPQSSAASFREEPQHGYQPPSLSGAAAAFDFNKALESARKQDAQQHVEDLDMMDHSWEAGRSRRPSQQSQPIPEYHTYQAPPQPTFTFGETQSNKPGPVWPNPQQGPTPEVAMPVARSTLSVEDYRYTPMGDLEPVAREQYLSENFTLGNIPIQPPPMEWCR